MKKAFFLMVGICSVYLAAMEHRAGYWNPEQYRKYAYVQRMVNEDILATCHFKGTENVLDVGCGDGSFTKDIAAYAKSVLGIDRDQLMVGAAREAFGNGSTITFECLSAENIESLDQSFDLITSFFCFQYVEEREKVFGLMKKLLNPEGSILIVMPVKKPSDPMRQAFQEVFDTYKHHLKDDEQKRVQTFLAGYDITCEEYKKMLSNSGFSETSVEVKTYSFTFDDKEQYEQWVNSWAESIAKMSSLNFFMQQVVIERFRSKYLENMRYTKGKFEHAVEIMVIRAR